VQKAVTLIELLIVISVMMVLTGLAIFNLRSIEGTANIEEVKITVVAALREAQTNSRAVLDDQRWGVHFETHKITIFADSGSGFDQSDSKNKVRLFDSNITCEVSFAGAGNDILFDKRTGRVDMTGTVTFIDGKINKIITINNEGSISYQ